MAHTFCGVLSNILFICRGYGGYRAVLHALPQVYGGVWADDHCPSCIAGGVNCSNYYAWLTNFVQNREGNCATFWATVVAKFATTAADGKRYQTDHYSLDMILSIGYRVKSQRGVEFRRWATNVLHKLIIQGHVENERRLEQLGTVAQIIERLPGDLGSREILDIVESYIDVFKLLDEYDRESIDRPKGQTGIYTLEYELCMRLIAQMRSRFTSDLFGVEKDESFRSSISVINQSFGGQDLYLSVQEKAANLLYLIIKNHSFLDGNKRIGCSFFLYYLDRNGLLFRGLDKRIADSTLVAVALMIAESRPEEKESMVSLVMNFLE